MVMTMMMNFRHILMVLAIFSLVSFVVGADKDSRFDCIQCDRCEKTELDTEKMKTGSCSACLTRFQVFHNGSLHRVDKRCMSEAACHEEERDTATYKYKTQCCYSDLCNSVGTMQASLIGVLFSLGLGVLIRVL